MVISGYTPPVEVVTTGHFNKNDRFQQAVLMLVNPQAQ